jgi:diaminopimelate decarboxylase
MNDSLPLHAPMHQFRTGDGDLLVGDVPLTRLAAIVGATPFYAYDRRLVAARVAEVREILPAQVKLHYAMKANPLPALMAHIGRLVDGVDVASRGELRVALDAGVSPAEISFAGPGKSAAELHQAVAAGILINVESAREIELLPDVERQLGVHARIALRVNPDFELKGSGMRMGGGPKQFGVDVEAVPDLLARIRELGLAFEGFHLFAGSQNLSAQSICEAQRASFDLAVRLAAHAPSAVRTLNLGGGFGIPYFPGEKRLDLAPIKDNLAELVARATRELPQARMVIELGRFLVGEAGIYVCRVVDRKISRGRVFLVTDGGLHHHLAASGNFGQVIRKNYPVAISTRTGTAALERASIVGPLCTPLDILGDQMELPVAEVGDLVVVFQSGAYGATASPQRFLSRDEVAEVLV